jgi:hypothetical protein
MGENVALLAPCTDISIPAQEKTKTPSVKLGVFVFWGE